MVKEHKKKRSQGVPTTPKSRPKVSVISDTRMAFSELRILFYLKRRGGASPSDLTKNAVPGHDYDRAAVCENLIKKKLIKKTKISSKSSVYIITKKGKESCDTVLKIINTTKNQYELVWFRLVEKIVGSSHKDYDEF